MPFWGKLIMHSVGIPNAVLRTKFSSNSSEDMLDRLPEILEVT